METKQARPRASGAAIKRALLCLPWCHFILCLLILCYETEEVMLPQALERDRSSRACICTSSPVCKGIFMRKVSLHERKHTDTQWGHGSLPSFTVSLSEVFWTDSEGRSKFPSGALCYNDPVPWWVWVRRNAKHAPTMQRGMCCDPWAKPAAGQCAKAERQNDWESTWLLTAATLQGENYLFDKSLRQSNKGKNLPFPKIPAF